MMSNRLVGYAPLRQAFPIQKFEYRLEKLWRAVPIVIRPRDSDGSGTGHGVESFVIGKPAEPACTVAEAAERLAADPRFALVVHEVDGRPVHHWQHGPKTVTDVLALYHAHGDREFLVYGDERCTYRGVLRAAETLAATLLGAGLQRGDRVALLMRNRLEWPVCFLAAIVAGGIAVPINGWSQPAEARSTIADCGARYLFSDRTDLLPLPEGVAACWTVGQGEAAGLESVIGAPAGWSDLAAREPGVAPADPDEIAAIFYTSGTTSRPKGAPITHRALTATIKNGEYNAERVRLRFPPAAPPAMPYPPAALFGIPFFHVTGAIPGLIGISAIGARIVMMRKWDVEEAFRIIERERITLVGGVPTMPLQLLDHPRRADYDLSSLTGLLYGGAPAPSALPEAIRDNLHAEASTGWGMTETASTLLHHSGPEYRLRPASCGVAVPVNEARIAAADDKAVAAGETGELQVRGLNVMRGYWDKPAETAASFTADGWFRTGDIARMDAEGFVTIVDRAKDIVIRGGENIACLEIEDVLSAHPSVVEAAVVGRPHRTLGEEPAAFVTLAFGETASEDGLKEYATSRLARHKVPVRIVVSADPLPKNPAGKVVKAELKRLASTL